jgi:hypothetical protein
MRELKFSLTKSPTLSELLSHRLPTWLEWITHGKMRYLVLCEVLFVLWLYLYGRAYLIARWKVLAFEIAFVLLLATLEHRNDLPLPFMRIDLDEEWISIFVVVFSVAFAITVILGLTSCGMQAGALVTLSFPKAILAMNAGITEESMKVTLTNAGTLGLQRIPIVKRSKLLSKFALCLVGFAVVAFWAWLHVLLVGVSIRFALTTFIIGAVYFVLVVSFKNYLPTVLAHALFDFVTPC